MRQKGTGREKEVIKPIKDKERRSNGRVNSISAKTGAKVATVSTSTC